MKRWWSCVLSSLAFTGWSGFILVIPSEENVPETPEKPGKYDYNCNSVWHACQKHHVPLLIPSPLLSSWHPHVSVWFIWPPSFLVGGGTPLWRAVGVDIVLWSFANTKKKKDLAFQCQCHATKSRSLSICKCVCRMDVKRLYTPFFAMLKPSHGSTLSCHHDDWCSSDCCK